MKHIPYIFAFFITLAIVNLAYSPAYSMSDPTAKPLQASPVMAFIEDMADAPLMAGMTLIDGAGFVFEQQNGRIVEKIAATDQQSQAIFAYYGLIMPQLGWVKSDDHVGRFTRDNEGFSIVIKTINNVQLVTFRLHPL